jgi:hypothetical protein
MNSSLDNKYSEIEITECICCWFDLLGFGKPFIDSNWNLNNDSCKKQLTRIKSLNSSLAGFYALTQGKSLTLNDGAIFNYDIQKEKEYLIKETVYFIDNIINDYQTVNYRDTEQGYPGARGIITYGHRYNYSSADTTVSMATNDNVSYHPKEFQMNTAFSKAYLMESSGSRAGISGNKLFFDNHLLSSIENLIKDKHGENSIYKTSTKVEESEMIFSVFSEDTRLISLTFKKESISYNNKGIITTLYEFIKKESIQDDLAYEAQYRRSVALSEMESYDEE